MGRVFCNLAAASGENGRNRSNRNLGHDTKEGVAMTGGELIRETSSNSYIGKLNLCAGKVNGMTSDRQKQPNPWNRKLDVFHSAGPVENRSRHFSPSMPCLEEGQYLKAVKCELLPKAIAQAEIPE